MLLINSEATHNFIHQALVEEKKIMIEKGTTFGVTIGDGTYYEGKRQCKRVELRLKELTIIVDLLAVELDRVDVILSMQWLETTGTMRVHWPSLTMTFWIGEIDYSKGDPSLIKAECSSKTIETTWES